MPYGVMCTFFCGMLVNLMFRRWKPVECAAARFFGSRKDAD